MSYRDVEVRRRARRRARIRRRRLTALGFLALGATAAAVAIAGPGGGVTQGATASRGGSRSSRMRRKGGAASMAAAGSITAAQGTGSPGRATVPILTFHVINPPIPGAPYPGLYVPEPEFAAQMRALKTAGWHAITLDQLKSNWRRGAPLGAGKPIVLTFDNGYQSQYTNALPVLRRLGWVGVENIQLSGLPPSQGGLSDGQVRGLLKAGWELDTQGISHADLITLNRTQLHYQVDTARHILRRRYGVPVDWFCYPSGHYNPAVIAAVKAAGYAGSTTVIPGWATPADDPYRLPRLRVLGGTTPRELLAQVAASEHASPAPSSYP